MTGEPNTRASQLVHPEPVLLPDEIASERGVVAYVAREAHPDAAEAIAVADREDGLGRPVAEMRAVPVLLREESEVEAKIHGHEFPLWVECTTRARSPVPYWRVDSA